MTSKYSPGAECVCCGEPAVDCELLNDTFDRADDTNLGTEWTEDAGAASIDGNELLVSSNNSRILGVTANPDNAHTKIVVEFKLVSGTSTARVFLGYLNSVNYLYATITTTGITIGQNGSSSKSRSQTISSGTWYTLTLCWNGTTLIAVLDGRQTSLSGLSTFGTQHGVGCGTASVRFNNFIATKVGGTCSVCAADPEYTACYYCDTGFIDAYWQVEVSGMTDGTCDQCENIDGLYLFDEMTGGPGTTPCSTEPVTGVDPCSPYLGPANFSLSLASHNLSGLGFRTGWRFAMAIPSGNTITYWNIYADTSPIDCEAISDEVLSGGISYQGVGASTKCTWTTATVTVNPWI